MIGIRIKIDQRLQSQFTAQLPSWSLPKLPFFKSSLTKQFFAQIIFSPTTMSKMQVEISLQINPELNSISPSPAALALTPQSEPDLLTEPAWQHWFQQWIELLNPELSPIQSYELGLLLTDDDEIQTLNAYYRQKNQPTDVLAFASLEADHPQPPELLSTLPLYLGDIVISVDTAQRQAHQQGCFLAQELAWLASHGLLHLLGWDHPDEAHLILMLDQQAELLRAVGFQISANFQQAWGLLEN